MDKRFKEIIKKAKDVTLSKTEKARGRERLLAVMRGVEAPATPAAQFSWFSRFARPVTAGFLVAALLGGGVSFASENTLPGDLLYPIKVRVNEEVRSVLATSVEGKAEWEARRAERRMEEALELDANGRLDEKLEEVLEAALEKHATKANENLAKAEAKRKSGNELAPEATTMLFREVELPEVAADAAFKALESRSAPSLKMASDTDSHEKEGDVKKSSRKNEQVQEKIAKARRALGELKASVKSRKVQSALELKKGEDRNDKD